MNKYPVWLNCLVFVILAAGCLLALPNIYVSVPAVQIADNNAVAYDEARLEEYVEAVQKAGAVPEAAYLQDGRVVLRFETGTDLTPIGENLKVHYGRTANIAQTLAPKLPTWMREAGLGPMSLGLDLRGGVYVLLEVDMSSAIDTRMAIYQDSLIDSLLEAEGLHRVELNNQVIRVRLNARADLEETREIIKRVDPDLVIADSTDGKSLTVRMSDLQIKAREDFAVDQNITTLRNRVNQLGVAGPERD